MVIHVANKTTRGDEPCDEYLNENHIAALASAVRERKTLSISVDPDTGRADLAPDTVRSTPDEGETNVRISTHPTPRLFITGAVHIAQPLCRMARDVGFDVNIIDPRTGFAREERFPGIPLIKEWPDEALAETPPDAATAIVTLTHDPKLDDAALIPALQSSAFYIGALGSRRTHEKRKARLREAGVSFEAIERISAPVGLPLGGRGPAEIALAITAELVKARYQSMTPTADAM
ncbi:MAG: XdhC family protein [Pseudomonadota bacterium]